MATTFVLGSYYGWQHHTKWCVKFIGRAIQEGITHFDAAHSYMQNKYRKSFVIGEAIRRYGEYYGEPCPTLWLSAKIGAAHEDDLLGPLSPSRLEQEMVDLETDYGRSPDVIFIHGNQRMDEWQNTGCIDWMIDQKRIGRIRRLGVSGAHGEEECVKCRQWLEYDADKHFDIVFMNYGVGFSDEIPEVRLLRKTILNTGRAIMYKKIFSTSPNAKPLAIGAFVLDSLTLFPEAYVCVGCWNKKQIETIMLFNEYYNTLGPAKTVETIAELRKLNQGHVRIVKGE